MPTRRTVLAGSVSLVGAATLGLSARANEPPALGDPKPFDFDRLIDEARSAAASPYAPAPIEAADLLAKIDYDAHWKIRFRDEASFSPPGVDAQIQLFHPGKYFPEPVRIHLVGGGEAREVLFRKSYFSMPSDSPAATLPHTVGFAGFRVMRPGLMPDWVSFLGASYLRTDGPYRQYGLSARGLALDTGLSIPEEFPRFSNFWIAAPQDRGETLTVYALLDSPSVAGAYQFGLVRDGERGGHATSVKARLFFRQAVERLGIAPLTSMYWYSQRDRRFAADWRPEIHDSDGLALATGSGERIWRPLNNSATVTTSSFADVNPKGFGLIQRDRQFGHYQDDGVFYNRRPSAWIAPLGDWGAGAVQLVEIPARDETLDNIVAYWTPASPVTPGDARAFDYRIDWVDRDPEPAEVATVTATWQGQGGIPGQIMLDGADKMVVDFDGSALAGLTVEDGVEPVVTAIRGSVVSEPSARPIVGAKGWRLIFDFDMDGADPVELRAYLRKDGQALTETWSAQATTPAREL